MADDEVKKEDETTETTDEPTDQQKFDDAFEEAVVDPEADEKKEETQEETPAETKEEPEVKEEKEETQDEIDWKAKAEAAEAEKAQTEQKMRSWEGRISAANKRAEDAEKKLQERDSTQAKDTPKEGDLPVEDDEAVLKDFIEEFPSLEKPVKALARKIASKIVEDRIKDIEPRIAQVTKQIEPMAQKIQADSDREHFDKISAAHSDWQEIRNTGKLNTWIAAQPSYVRSSLERVVKEGSTEEVIEMFDTYKGQNRLSSTSTIPRGKSPSKKAQDLLAVDSSASGVPKGKGKLDKDSFDAGWEDALRD